MTTVIDRTGHVHGWVTVISRSGSASNGAALWKCKCACGNVWTVSGENLKNGRTKSCGCLRARHGRSKDGVSTPEYSAWLGMRYRCKKQGRIGLTKSRGQGVCNRWMHSFKNFLSDMGPKPTANHRLNRIDIGVGYNPSNCRWEVRHKKTESNKETPS